VESFDEIKQSNRKKKKSPGQGGGIIDSARKTGAEGDSPIKSEENKGHGEK
jgi:hypothetical protein